jgi:hypothetical protein
VAEAVMPEGRRGGEAAGGRWCGGEGVEVATTIAAKNHAPRLRILDRKTTRVKFNGTSIVTGELTNREKVAYKSRGNQNIVKMKSRVLGG